MTTKNTVSTLGTLHDNFLSNPNFGLKDFTSALYQFKPDFIFSEVLTDKSNAGDASIDGGIEQAIVYAYAKEQGIPVIATDWYDGALIQEMIEEGNLVTPELMETLKAVQAFRGTFETASLLELNSESIQGQVRETYKVFEANGIKSYRKRNDRIISNIKNELQHIQGKRVLVIYGMDHKFFIDDHLKGVASVEVQSVSEWFRPELGKSFKISESLRRDSLQNLKTSESMLEARLKDQNLLQVVAEKMKAKLPRFGVWASSISKM